MNEKQNGEGCVRSQNVGDCGERKMSSEERIYHELQGAKELNQLFLTREERSFEESFDILAAANKRKLLSIVEKMKTALIIEIAKGNN